MKRIVAILLVLLVVVLSVSAACADDTPTKEKRAEKSELQIFKEIGKETPKETYVADEILVKFKHGIDKDKIDRINAKHGASVKEISTSGKFLRIKIPKEKTVAEMVELYKAEEDVEYAEPNYIAHALWIPNDPYYRYQWHLDNNVYGGIGMEEAWGVSTGTGVIVAVIDTGVAYENYQQFIRAPDLAGTSFVAGYDFVNNDTHPNDDNAHGTHVTGTIAQSTNNGLGVAGVAFGAQIMPIKVLDSGGSGYYSWIANGIYYAADHGAKIISMSLGGGSPSSTLEAALGYAYNKNVTIIAAAGNDGTSTVAYPAAYDDYVIAVGATRYDETLADYSNYGPSLDLVAPGGDVSVDQNGDGYGDGVLQNTFNPNTKKTSDFGYWFFDGTSMATPHVSGVAALVIAHGNADANRDGITSPSEVRAALQETAEDLGDTGFDVRYGWGLVDAPAALQWEPYGTMGVSPTSWSPTVNAGLSANQTVTISATNGSVNGVTVSKVSGPTWLTFTPSSLGDIPAGTNKTFTMTAAPPANASGDFAYTVRVNNTCGTPTTMNVTGTIRVGMCGDVNGDQLINMVDALAVRNYWAFGTPISNLWAGDVNCDGEINMIDALAIRNSWAFGTPLSCCL